MNPYLFTNNGLTEELNSLAIIAEIDATYQSFDSISNINWLLLATPLTNVYKLGFFATKIKISS